MRTAPTYAKTESNAALCAQVSTYCEQHVQSKILTMPVTGRRHTGHGLPTRCRPHSSQTHLCPKGGEARVRAARVHAHGALVETRARAAAAVGVRERLRGR